MNLLTGNLRKVYIVNVMIFKIWLVVVSLISVCFVPYIPFQLVVFVVLFLVASFTKSFLGKKHNKEFVYDRWELLRTMLMPCLFSAYAFKTMGDYSIYAENKTLVYLLTVQVVLFGIMALLVYSSRDKAKNESIWLKGFKYSFLLFALIVSALTLLIPKITGMEISGQIHSQFKIAGFVTEYGVRLLPKWFVGSNLQATLSQTAPGAWIICFGGIVLIYAREQHIKKYSDNRMGIVFFVILVLVLGFNTFENMENYQKFMDTPCFIGADKQDEFLRDMYNASDSMRNIDFAYGELKVFQKARKCFAGKNDNAKSNENLDPRFLTDISSRLILLEPDVTRHQLTFASSLFRINELDGLKLFDPEKIDNDKLGNYIAETLSDAVFLSAVYMYRNKIEVARDILEPFVNQMNLNKELNKTEKKAVVEYAEYCLYTGKFNKGLDALTRFQKYNDDDYRTFITLGELYYEKDDLAKAFINFNKAYQRNKYERRIIWNLVALYYQTNDTEAVIPHAKKLQKKFLGTDLIGKQHGNFYLPGESFIQTYLIPGRIRVGVVARGTPAKGEWPIMEFWVNGKKQGMARVDSQENKGFAFEFNARRGINRLAFKFVNDYAEKKEDRNLAIVSGFIQPVFYEGKKR